MSVDKTAIAVPLKDAVDDFRYNDDGFNAKTFWENQGRELNRWAADIYSEKRGHECDFFMGTMRITAEDLSRISEYKDDIKRGDKEHIKAFRRLAGRAIKAGYALYYEAW